MSIFYCKKCGIGLGIWALIHHKCEPAPTIENQIEGARLVIELQNERIKKLEQLLRKAVAPAYDSLHRNCMVSHIAVHARCDCWMHDAEVILKEGNDSF